MNVVDKIIGAVSPVKQLKREHARAMIEMAQLARSAAFKASQTTRLNSNLPSWNGDLNVYLKSELRRIRNRSRWLCCNNPHATSAIGTLTAFAVGTGLVPQSGVRKMVKTVGEDGLARFEPVELEAWNDYADDLWHDWSGNVDLTGSPDEPISMYEIQCMALRRWFEDGEVFIRTRAVKGWPHVPFAVEVLMPEWLDETMFKNETTGNDVIMGIEVDKFGRKVAYHFRAADSEGVASINKRSVRVPASEMIHLYIRHQPRQLRGIPPMVSVLERFFHLDEYVDYELIAAKIAACFGAFITTPSGDSGNVVTTQDENGETSTNVTDAEGNILTTVEPGIIGKLPPGYGVSFAQPQKPGATFGLFTEYHQRTLGAGIEFGISYEAISKDTSKSNFAGGRLAQLSDFQTYRSVQKVLADKLVRPIRNRWMDAAVSSAALTAPGYFMGEGIGTGKAFWQRCDILTSGWSWGINPLQEVNASRESMKAGITTLADEAAYLGRDWKSQLRLKAKIDRECKRLKVVINSDAANDKKEQTQNVQQPVDENEEEKQTAGQA